MPDLLVNLLKLPALDSALRETASDGIIIRPAQPFEINQVRSFVLNHFSTAWADEISVGFARQPVSLYIATEKRTVVGFAGYECTRRGFFGPMGVADSARGRGVGKALLIASLWGLRDMGYVYAIIGRAGPVEFYEKTVAAFTIPGSETGIYTDLLP